MQTAVLQCFVPLHPVLVLLVVYLMALSLPYTIQHSVGGSSHGLILGPVQMCKD
jgi:hypothetical protein